MGGGTDGGTGGGTDGGTGGGTDGGMGTGTGGAGAAAHLLRRRVQVGHAEHATALEPTHGTLSASAASKQRRLAGASAADENIARRE